MRPTSALMESPPDSAGQVCDRCRVKKIKCDGLRPCCTNCSKVNSPCMVSARLRRQTKIRGFDVHDERVNRFKEQNEELKRQLQAERDRNAILQHQLDQLKTSSNLSPGASLPSISTPSLRRPPVAPSASNSDMVIKHVGRLVRDTNNVERFAGSTTGLHFIISVEQALMTRRVIRNHLPENCLRLHLLGSQDSVLPELLTKTNTDRSSGDIVKMLQQQLQYPLTTYVEEISRFETNWASLCPVIAKTDLTNNLQKALECLYHEELGDVPCLFQILMILCINSAESDLAKLELIVSFLPEIIFKGTIECIQSLILLGFYVQIRGHQLLMPQINGILVKSAQLAGLHRHSRRFKFGLGQVELRRRLWWCVYAFDKITSIANGLPQLIQDQDVDIDLPSDCYLDTTFTSQLTYPLPGETTTVSAFISLIHLMRISASMLEQLYTTTKRREGAGKMAFLIDRLHTWHQSSTTSASNEEIPLDTHLSLFYNLIVLLIHRPGLTFNEDTPQFRDCLDRCTAASSAIVDLVLRPEVLPFQLLGPSLLFQCALMHAYYQCHYASSSRSGASVHPDVSRELIVRVADFFASGEVSFAGHTGREAFLEAARTLRMVAAAQSGLSPASDIGGATLLPEPAVGVRMDSGGIFSDLNQLQYCDWAVDALVEGGLDDWGWLEGEAGS